MRIVACGIGGIIKKGVFAHEDAVASYMLLTSLTRRGTDAWGFFDGRRVYKEPGSFTYSPNKGLVLDLAGKTNMFLCHTRAATTGDPRNNENNHPLVIHPLVMAHNGLIFSSDPYPKPPNIEVDSYDLLYWIHYEYTRTGDIVKGIEEGVKHVTGLYAVWLYNFDDNYVYVFRNSNPLLVTHVLAGDGVIIFASDRVALKDALVAYGYETIVQLKLYRSPHKFKTYLIYRLSPDGVEVVGEITPTPVPVSDYFTYISRHGGLLRYHLDDIGDEISRDYTI